jgi:hypothetical protein
MSSSRVRNVLLVTFIVLTLIFGSLFVYELSQGFFKSHTTTTDTNTIVGVDAKCGLYWEGTGNIAGTNVSLDWYDSIRASLSARFRERFFEVGYARVEGDRWLVALTKGPITKDDTEFVKNLFPSYITVELWIVGANNITIIVIKPPIIQFNCP